MQLLAVQATDKGLSPVALSQVTSLILLDDFGNRLFVAGEQGISKIVSFAAIGDAGFEKLQETLGLSEQRLHLHVVDSKLTGGGA